jgi:DNA mismatch repair ATPase MutS
LFNALTTFYIRVSGIVTFTLFILTLARPNQYYFITLMAAVLGNFAVHYANKGRIAQYTHSLPQLIKLINVAKWFRKQQGTTPDEATAEAIKHTNKLKRSLRFVSISEKVNDPTDITFALMELLRILFLLEPLMFVTSINRVNKYRLSIGHVYEYVSRIDFLISIISLRAGLPYYSKPGFSNSNQLAVDALYHPLIADAIPNDMVTSADKGVLITGSNMSGKTTFIRAMAINTLLSQTIFTSCSKSYSAPWLNIYTSIRISDDVEEHKSYFQAEAISVLDILQKCDANKPAKSLVIIDEIFRGTNTIERIAAAKAVLAYLTANNNFVFVSTHDLELAELLGTDYTVYSFEEVVTDGARLVFDYKIKEGLLKNKNGIAILNALGYPQSVVDDAGVVSEQLRAKYQL